MKEFPTIRACFIVLLVLGHGVAGLQFLLRRQAAPVPIFWMNQAAALLALSALLAAVLFFQSKNGRKFVFLLAELVILLLVSYPEGNSLAVKTTLLVLLVFETAFFLPLPAAVGMTGLEIVLALAVTASAGVWTAAPVSPPEAADRLSLVFFPLFAGTTAVFLKRALQGITRQKEMIGRLDNAVTRLTGANLGFQEYAAAAGQESAENERKRIARDIHDTIGYHLMNMIMMMEAAVDITPEGTERLKDILIQTRDQAKEGLKETRNALRALRSTEEERLGGLKAIQKLVAVFERVTGVEVQREYGNIPFLFPEAVFSCIYRMVQEGLTNAFKHGRATKIVLHFWIDDRRVLKIRIRDNGRGSSGDIKAGIGLAGMRERVEKLNGTLETGNVFDGFELVAGIPLEGREEYRGDTP